MDARRVLIAIACTAPIAAACFSDLPPASKCPADATRAIEDCTQVLFASQPKPGCNDQAAVRSCMVGDRASCECSSTDCPPSKDACFPNDECPAEVRKTSASGKCPRLGAPSTVAAPADARCSCGCTKCLDVCDGYGPMFSAVVTHGANPVPLLSISLTGLPASGRFGLYVRSRGLARIAVQVGIDGPTPMIAPLVTPSFEPDFVERVILPPSPQVSWTEAAAAPKQLFLFAAPPDQNEPPQNSAVTLVQIDCIVPIVE